VIAPRVESMPAALPLKHAGHQLNGAERDSARPGIARSVPMPIINVKVSAAKAPETSQKIARMLLDKTTSILRKRADLTAITIDYVDPEHWIVGGQSLRAQGKSSFYFDIKVVDETNTKAEKARYVAEVFDGFRELLGDLHDESYVYVQDVRPTAYGFGGQTQEYRYQHEG
jgi:4-oxalocrotonate tautomerase